MYSLRRITFFLRKTLLHILTLLIVINLETLMIRKTLWSHLWLSSSSLLKPLMKTLILVSALLKLHLSKMMVQDILEFVLITTRMFLMILKAGRMNCIKSILKVLKTNSKERVDERELCSLFSWLYLGKCI